MNSPAERPGGALAAVALPLFFASGATGLCYEVLWSRMLAFEFGASIFGIAVTLGAFLGGLGAGALLAGRLARGLSAAAALRAFALLELAVAVYALALPGLRGAGDAWLDALGAALAPWQWRSLEAACAALLLMLPAAALGASFPVMLRAAPPSGARVGRLYGFNTLGAACGALLALLLLARLGWDGALRVVCAAGALVAGAAWLLAGRAPRAAAAAPGMAPVPRPAVGTLVAYAGVGACALALEIAWTRLYGLVMLRTEYVLAIILAVYLAGAALGSLAAAGASSRRLAAAVPIVACAATLAGLAALPALALWVQSGEPGSLEAALAADALALGLFTLPTTAALGAWLPLLAQRAGNGAERAAAWLYGANCTGAAAGAVATVCAGLPCLGTSGTVCLAAFGLLACGAPLVPARLFWPALALAAAGAWWLRELPAAERLLPDAARAGHEIFRFEDALTLNQVVRSPDGEHTLLTDLQRMDASSDPDAVRIQGDQARLPLLLHRDPRSVLFLGMGTGISAGASLAWPALERTAVELSPGAIAAAGTLFAAVNGGVLERMRVEHDDARHFLLAHAQRYDVIVGDLFHPDMAGMSQLLTVEQFGRARAHLQPGGVFAQWLALNQFDRASLHAVLRSFARVFPGGAVFLDGMHLAMVGSPQPQAYGGNLIAHAAAVPARLLEAQTGGEGPLTWLGRYGGGVDGGEGEVQSETRPLIEYRLPRLRYRGSPPLDAILIELLRRRPAPPDAAVGLGIGAGERAAFTDAYGAAGLAVQSWIAALGGDRARASELLRLAYDANPRDRWVAGALADELYARAGVPDRQALEGVLRVDPDHVEALRSLWHLDRDQDAAAACRTLARLHALVPLDAEIAATPLPGPDCGRP